MCVKMHLSYKIPSVLVRKESLKIVKRVKMQDFSAAIAWWDKSWGGGRWCACSFTQCYEAFSCCFSLFMAAVKNNSCGNHLRLSAALCSSSTVATFVSLQRAAGAFAWAF